MATLNTTATFMDGNISFDYATLEQVNAAVVGQQIKSVRQSGHNSITFELANGASMTLTSSGLEGDDLDLNIEIPC